MTHTIKDISPPFMYIHVPTSFLHYRASEIPSLAPAHHSGTQIHADESQRHLNIEDNMCSICVHLRLSVAKNYVGSKR